jgi:hypothetical protein
MLWRIPARLVTGPLAFFVAGVIDVLILTGAILWAALRKRLRPQ